MPTETSKLVGFRRFCNILEISVEKDILMHYNLI